MCDCRGRWIRLVFSTEKLGRQKKICAGELVFLLSSILWLKGICLSHARAKYTIVVRHEIKYFAIRLRTFRAQV